MKGKRVFRENSCHRNFSKKTKTVSDGKVKGTSEKVILIDLDDDNVVFIDDAAEPSQKNCGASGVPREHRGKSSVEGVIHIDDDDDACDMGPRTGADRDLVSDASSSQSRFPMFKTMGSCEDTEDECEFVKEKTSAFQFSKCKQTYCTSSKAPARNHYGLHSAFDKDLTDSDSSDCEIVADSYGNFREQWEKAKLKRKHAVHNRHSGVEDHSSASESTSGTKAKNTVNENSKEQHPNSGSADCMEEKQPEVATNGGHAETPFKTSSESSSMDVDEESEGELGSIQEKGSFRRKEDFQPGGGLGSEDPRNSDCCKPNENAYDGIPANKNKEPSHQQSFKPEGGSVVEGPYFCNECNSENICHCSPIFWNYNEPSPPCSLNKIFEEKVVDKQSTHPRTSSMEERNTDLDSGKASVPNSRLYNETKVDSGVPLRSESFGRDPEDTLSHRVPGEGKSKRSNGKACDKDKVRSDSKGDAVQDRTCDGPSSNLNESFSVGVKEPNGNIECSQNVNVIPVENCVITDRQKLNDTEEYKQAIEQEWEARNRELQIQAEEAKRLRKRKKAEVMRLCDIERRQRQRVEEVRQTQKKNAEDINLKEKFRGEIRKEITKLEITCIDMASLLRGLGIPVNGPMSQDVNAAYKRALLKFHPDRASRMDIRQQVESEEKFKLISRMKEKFLTSCC